MSNNRAALVTGGTRGIGRAIATVLAEEGYDVTVTARTAEAVELAQHELQELGVEALGVVADVSDAADVERLVAEHESRAGRLDVLVNNAGAFVPGPVSALSPDALDGLLATNVRSVLLVSQAAIPLLRKAGAEHRSALLVNVASIVGHYGQALTAGYSATKGGVLALTQALHDELAPDGVKVTALSPALVDTDMTAALSIPSDELIRAQDLGEAVRFLLRTSPAAVVPEILMMRSADRLYSAI